jgi:hypothetical protein
VDLVFVQRLGQRFNLRVSFENLTDPAFESTQGDRRQRSYQIGRTFGVAFGVDVF